MPNIIGVSIPFSTQERTASLTDAAHAAGCEIEFFEPGTMTQEQLDRCTIFFGMARPHMVARAARLKWFQASFAGVDTMMQVEPIVKGDIVLTNASGAYGITISEHLIVTLLMLMRKMPAYYEMQQRSEWGYAGQIQSIYGSTITVVGTGDIGGNFGARVKAMGATVRGVRRNAAVKPDFCDEVYGETQLLEAISGADAVALCVPGTDKTTKFFGERELRAMKSNAILLNVGRGSAVDLDALDRALRDGTIGGAALDVTDPEPLPPEHPLWSAPNILITPHVSGNVSLPLTCNLVCSIFTDNLRRYTAGEPLRHVIDCKNGY
ncbi:MAG: hypothetical protein ABT01_02145 [Clostridium sp. SCN 57-10]|nr:MAG: hypothetical protein ABT01_02145 [Clostridium sp. SCN 57-10]